MTALREHMFVLVYSHRHGHDYSVFRSVAGARQCALDIMSNYQDQFAERAERTGNGTAAADPAIAELQAAHDVGDFAEAARIWEAVTDESFEILEREVAP